MEDNEDEPDDVKQATPVEEEITKGEIDEHSGNSTVPIEPARRRHQCEKDRVKDSKKSLKNREECCREKLAKAARAPKTRTVLVYDKECTFPKIKCIPRHCLSKEEWIDVLATPKRTCPSPCFQREVTRKIRPVSTRINELAQPPKSRLVNTLQDRAGTLPIELVDNLIQTLEGETCLTPEQAERMFRDKDIRARKKCRKRKSKLNCKGSKSIKREEPKIVPNASPFDKEAVSCQYMMAESFVKSILEWETPIPREEFKDIAEVILKRLGYVLEYNPVNSEDRKSQQMRFLADVVASWISGVLFDVAEAQKTELEEECEKKRQEMEEESEEDSDDETEEDDDDNDDDDDDDDDEKDTKKKKEDERKPPKKGKDDEDKKGRGDGKDDEDDDDDKKGGTPGQKKEGKGDAGDVDDAEDTLKKGGNVEVDESESKTQDLPPDDTAEPQEMEGTTKKEDGIDGTEESGSTSDEKKNLEKKPEEMEDETRQEAEDKIKEEAEAKLKAEAEDKVKEEAEAKLKAEAEDKVKEEAEAKSKAEAEDKIKEEAEAKLKAEAEDKVKEEAEAKSKAEAEDKIKEEAEAKLKAEAEDKIKGEAEAKSKAEAEDKIKEEAEAKSKVEAEEQLQEKIPDKTGEDFDPDSSPDGVQIKQAEDDKILATSDEVTQDKVDEPSKIEEKTEAPIDISQSLAETKETGATPSKTDGTDSEKIPIDEETTKPKTDEQIDTTKVSEIPEAKEKDVILINAEDVDKEVKKDESHLEDTAKVVDEATGIKKETSQTKKKPSKIPSIVTSVKIKKYQSDTPFVTFDKIFHTIYNAIEASRENPGEDPITNRIHRAVYEKCSNVVQEEKPEPLAELTKDVLDVLSGKIALWLRDILNESQLAFMNKFPATVESGDVREWNKWLAHVSDTANTWSTWIQQTIRQAEAMRSGKVTRGDWLDWTKSIGEDALLWRRFYVESLHQAHQNLTMIRDRQVVKTGTRIIPGDDYEKEMKITDLETDR